MINWYKKSKISNAIKTSQSIKYFDWDDNNGGTWEIGYRDISPEEMYANGKALSDKEIMTIMIQKIQNKYSDASIIDKDKILYFIDKLQLSPKEFFDEVTETERIHRDEAAIEQRDIDNDPDGYFQR